MKPRKPESHVGTWGWVGLAVYVAAWDFTMSESLTHSFERGMNHDIGRLAVLGATAYTVGHLVGLLPKRLDLFYAILEINNEAMPTSIDNA